MSILNDLHMYDIEVIVGKDGEKYFVDVRNNRENGKFEDGEYIAGYSDLNTEDDAEFLARAFIDGYKLGVNK